MLRVRTESVLAALFAMAAILTAVWPAWIEGLLGFDPDGGNGATEWWIVVALAVAAIVSAVLHIWRYVLDPRPGGTRP